MDANYPTDARGSSLRPSLVSSRSKGSFERQGDAFTNASSGPLDDALGVALSGTSASHRHRSASPAPNYNNDLLAPVHSPSSRHFGGQATSSSLLGTGSGSLASAMNFRGPGSASSLGIGSGPQSSAVQSPHAHSPSFAAQYATSSDHSRHSSGHGSSLTGASMGTSGGGFGGFDLGSAASSSGEPAHLGKTGGHFGSTRGSFSGSPHIGGGLGVPSDLTGFADSKMGRSAGNTISQSHGASMTNLTSALARTGLNDTSTHFLVSPSSKASSTAGSSQGRPGIHELADQQSSVLRFANAALDQSASLGGSPSPFLQEGDSTANASSPFLLDGRNDATSNSVPVSLPTTGPLSAADPRTQLYISNLPYRVRWQDVKDLFRRAGTVLRADVSLTPDNRSRGIGTVLMASEDDARRACDMFRGFNWQGRTLDVKIDRSGTILGVGVGHLAAPGMLGVAGSPLPATPGSGSRGSPMPSPLGVAGGSGASPTNAPANSVGPIVSPMAQQPDLVRQSSNNSSQRMPLTAAQYSNHASPALPSMNNNLPRASAAMPNLQMEATLASARARGMSPSAQSQLGQQQVPAGSPYYGNAFGTNLNGAGQQVLGAQGLGMRGGGAPYAQSQVRPAQAYSPFGGPQAQAQAQAMANLGYLGTSEQQMRALNPMLSTFGSAVRPNNAMANLQAPAFAPAPTVSHAYYGRVLFVGNLPFHCQWQDLKDLFRAAGNIQRADVALSPDGKSRGFGTVLFATPEDARNAVRIYHGYEYSGRTLKVHFDRFAQMTVPQPNVLPASPSQYTSAFAAANTPTHVGSSGAGAQGGAPNDAMQNGAHMHPAQQQQQQQRMPSDLGQHAQHSTLPAPQQNLESYMQARGTSLPPKPVASAFEGLRLSESRRGSSATDSLSMATSDATPRKSDAARHGDAQNAFGTRATQDARASRMDSQEADDRLRTPQLGQNAHFNNAPGALRNRSSIDNGSSNGPGSGAHPGRIALPPQGFMAPSGMPPFSPIQSRMSVPMTPGMPGFNFHGVPQTPPVAQHLFSPGLGGLLSPGIGSPTYGVGTPGIGFGSLINPAPGAPVHYNNGTTTPMASMMSMATAPGFNPMFPPIGMPYQPSAYQDQHVGLAGQSALPQTPHWSQPRVPPAQQYVGLRQQQQQPQQSNADAVGPNQRPQTVGEEDEGPSSTGQQSAEGKEQRAVGAGSAGQTSTGSAEGYPFPAVGDASAESTAAPLQRRNSTNTPLMSPTAPNGPASLAVKSPGWEQRRGSSSDAFAASTAASSSKAPISFEALGLHDIHVSAGATTTEELARKIAQMSAEKSLRQQQQRAESTSAIEKGPGNARALAAPLELSLGKASNGSAKPSTPSAAADQQASNALASALAGSALDDGASSAGSQSADVGLHLRQPQQGDDGPADSASSR